MLGNIFTHKTGIIMCRICVLLTQRTLPGFLLLLNSSFFSFSVKKIVPLFYFGASVILVEKLSVQPWYFTQNITQIVLSDMKLMVIHLQGLILPHVFNVFLTCLIVYMNSRETQQLYKNALHSRIISQNIFRGG